MMRDPADLLAANIIQPPINARKELGEWIDIRELRARVTLSFLSPGMEPALFFSGKQLGVAYGKRMGKRKLDDILRIYRDETLKLRLGSIQVVREGKRLAVRRQESATAAGLDLGRNVCAFDAGALSGLLSQTTGQNYAVIETKCMANGAPYCEFEIRRIKLVEELELAFKV